MTEFNFYHNPRCSKSREALILLQENNIKIKVIPYLEQPLTITQIKNLLGKLKLKAGDLIRRKEELFKQLNLQNADEEQLIQAMSENPKLIERPILETENGAIIGRPPIKVLELACNKI